MEEAKARLVKSPCAVRHSLDCIHWTHRLAFDNPKAVTGSHGVFVPLTRPALARLFKAANPICGVARPTTRRTVARGFLASVDSINKSILVVCRIPAMLRFCHLGISSEVNDLVLQMARGQPKTGGLPKGPLKKSLSERPGSVQ
jgi:hypothetical protein